MHKLKIYIVSSICFLLFSCKEKVTDMPLTGVFVNQKENENKYAILKNGKLLFPLDEKYKTKDDKIILKNDIYTKFNTNLSENKFDSIEISYNTDNYESVGIKEFDAKIYPNAVVFYDVEKNTTKKIKLDRDFENWISSALNMDNDSWKNVNKQNNRFIACIIIYNKDKSKIIFNNIFNNVKDSSNLFMTLLSTYLTLNRREGEVVTKKTTFRSLDSLNHFIDKNNIGIKRIPLPNND